MYQIAEAEVTEKAIAVKKFVPEETDYSDGSNLMILWMKKGFTTIRVDFKQYSLQPNSICFISEGKTIRVNHSGSPEGWILKFSKDFLFTHIREKLIIKDADLFGPDEQLPRIVLSPKIGERIHSIVEMIDELAGTDHPHRNTASASLLKSLLCYCDSQCNVRVTRDSNRSQLSIVTRYKTLVSAHFHQLHHVSDYAELMKISAKYLNQVVKEVLGVTAKTIIQEQLIIQARRELKFSDESIKEIAYGLGFSDPFYFSNYFKKEMGCSPSEYRER